jgi:hypothetical protein
MKYRLCGRILAIALLASFWKMPVFGEQPTTQKQNSEESGTRRYSEYEVDALIEDLTAAAAEAIEQAAAEAARAAMLASLEKELRAAAEARKLREENGALRKSRVKTAVVTGLVCFFGGLAIGASGVLIIQGGR